MRDVLELLKTQQETERSFVNEVQGQPDPSEGWTPAMMFFHLAQWRERLWNALAEAGEGRPVNAPAGDIDELNDREMEGATRESLAEAAARSDAALTSLIAMLETMGDRPFKWYAAETVAEAIVRNSYLHPRHHLADQLLQMGDEERGSNVLEETAEQLRRAEAPPYILGAALFNLARVRATQGRLDEALTLLEEAVSMRPEIRSDAKDEPDFEPVRDSPRFRALVELP
jgi:tetratricopeptide (TPR) repeat protein